MEKLINELLNDENGISEEAFNALVEYLEDLSNGQGFNDGAEAIDIIHDEGVKAEKLLAEVKRADATDGRFYYPSEG